MKKIFELSLLGLLSVFVVFVLGNIPKVGTDFYIYLYPAGRAVLDNQNPYEVVQGFYNPPWMLFFVVPVSFFQVDVSRWVWFSIGLVSYIAAFRRMGFSTWTVLLLLTNPFLYYDLAIGNYEWIILLGVTLPVSIGSWFVILKPQVSCILMGYWIKQGKWKTLIPVAVIALLIIFQIYKQPNSNNMPWSTDIFPYGIPFGILLGYFAIKRNDFLLALAAGPFFAPYVGITSWIVALLPLARNKFYLIIGILIGWVFLFLFVFREVERIKTIVAQ